MWYFEREFKPANDALNVHQVELVREGPIPSTKYKLALICREVKLLYEKQLALKHHKFYYKLTTLLLAPLNVKWEEKALWWKSSRAISWTEEFRFQVQAKDSTSPQISSASYVSHVEHSVNHSG